MRRLLRDITLFEVAAALIAAVLLLIAWATIASAGDWIEPPQYKQAYDLAVANGKPLVLMIGVEGRMIEGCVSVALDDYYGNATPRIIVGRPTEIGTILPPASTDKRIRAAAFPQVVSRPAVPFAERDDEDAVRFVPVLAELEIYTRAAMTQQTFRRVSGVIHPFPRSRVLAKWNKPGGLEGVQGWSSRLYRTKDMTVRPFLTRQDPNDNVSAITWWQNYPDGAVFADVLRNEAGEVFEVRVAEKQGTAWDRFVAYKNVAARPHGYHPPTRSECRSCHAGAGLSEYGAAANPGADSVISHPIEPLESGRSVQGGYGERL